MIPHRIGYISAQAAKGQSPTHVSPEPLSSSIDAALATPAMSKSVEISRNMLTLILKPVDNEV